MGNILQKNGGKLILGKCVYVYRDELIENNWD